MKKILCHYKFTPPLLMQARNRTKSNKTGQNRTYMDNANMKPPFLPPAGHFATIKSFQRSSLFLLLPVRRLPQRLIDVF